MMERVGPSGAQSWSLLHLRLFLQACRDCEDAMLCVQCVLHTALLLLLMLPLLLTVWPLPGALVIGCMGRWVV